MRTEEEIRKDLQEATNDPRRYEVSFLMGWIKALEWVLNDKGEK